MMQMLDIAARWREEAVHLRTRYHDETKARLCETHAEELEDALKAAGSEVLTLCEASKRSGFSVDHLGRMVRTGKIVNAGKKGSPRIYARDLPSKPGLTREAYRPQLVGSSKMQVARSVLSQERG